MMPIIECVPNFSEGQKPEVIQSIAKAIGSVEGVHLLHQDSGFAANRTVFTFAGELESVFEAAYRAIEVASLQIDMRLQKGEHPRIGACDVCPFVPISGISIEELVPYTLKFAEKVSTDFNIPVFLYENSAKSEVRKNLAHHRIGGYEGLNARMISLKSIPDYGQNFNPKFGGMVCGARPFLVAYNINLNTKDAKIAQEIAYDLRELGRPIGKVEGKHIYHPGLLKHVKAIGWYIEDFKKAQVSINLINYKKTSLFEVFENTKILAKKYKVKVTGSELIGLIPKDALLEAGSLYLNNSQATEEEKIQSAIKELGLNEIQPFKIQKRILEYRLSRSL